VRPLAILLAVCCCLSAASGQWLETTTTVGSGPWDLVYNPTDNKVYCAHIEGSNVTVIDGAADTVITTITVGAYPRAPVWNPVQNRT